MNTNYSNPIGGYFDLELQTGNEYHENAIKLNSARNAFKYLMKVNKIKKIFIPYYICDVMIETILNCKVKYEYYEIDKDLNPIFRRDISQNDAFLYINYFGIKDKPTEILKLKINNLFIDNAQSFYYKPIKNTFAFYSCRKFFGVPDGAYLYANKDFNSMFEKDISNSRMKHLITRIERGAEAGYKDFLENENIISRLPIRQMSNLTLSLMKSIKYNIIKRKRMENFYYMHKRLEKYNELNINLNSITCPMVYPFLINYNSFRKKLIRHNIYIAQYWKNVSNIVKKDSVENYITNNLLPLPIDQRYGLKEMKLICNFIEKKL